MTRPVPPKTRRQQRAGVRLQAEITRLRDVEGLTQQQTAEALGLSPKSGRNTVRKYERKALMELQNQTTAELRQAKFAEHAERLDQLNAFVEERKKTGKPYTLAELEFFHSLLKTEIQLFGTSAPSRSVVGHINSDERYEWHLEIDKHTAGLTVDQRDDVCRYAASLPRPWDNPEYREKQLAQLSGPDGKSMWKTSTVIEGMKSE